uniref:ASH1L n=1 Tax=Amphiprion percula TaxID=161767 RepID=A0A3P8S2X4_AMPPE
RSPHDSALLSGPGTEPEGGRGALKRGEGENGDAGKKEEEKRGAGRKREGDKGAVLELLIEGRCGGQQIPGREASCPEGNVRVRIGLQAKRTKKPPKILESYVCKPTIRTYQRQGRGLLKAGAAQDEAAREQCSVLDAVQTTSKQTASAASTALTSSSLPAKFTTAPTPTPVPTVTKAAKQVSLRP